MRVLRFGALIGLGVLGAAWTEMDGSATSGGVSDTPGISEDPAVAVAADGRIFIAWTEHVDVEETEIYVAILDPAANRWVEYLNSASGVGISDTSDATQPAIAADPLTGHPTVVWKDTDPDDPIGEGTPTLIKGLRWNGAAWVEMSGSTSPGLSDSGLGQIAEHPSVAFTSAGALLVAWDQIVPDFGPTDPLYFPAIYVKTWTASSGWSDFAGSGSSGGITGGFSATDHFPSIACDSSGNPQVAWEHDDGSSAPTVYFKRYAGGEWEEVMGSATGGGVPAEEGSPASSPSLAMVGDDPIIAWVQNSNILVSVYGNSTMDWFDWGSGSGTGLGVSGLTEPFSAEGPSLQVDADGRPLVVFQVLGGFVGTHIENRQWNDPDWTALMGDDISQPGAGTPCLAFGAGRNPCIAWTQDMSITGPVTSEIYAKCMTEVSPIGLAQFRADGNTPLGVGALTSDTTVALVAGVVPVDGRPVEVQIQYGYALSDFSGEAQFKSGFVTTPQTFSFPAGPLPAGSYKWRARVVSPLGGASAWFEFGGNTTYAADFIIHLVIAQRADGDDGDGWCFNGVRGGDPAWNAGLAVAALGLALLVRSMARR